MARESTDGSNYFILLILTDGVITDMDQTVDAIVAKVTNLFCFSFFIIRELS